MLYVLKNDMSIVIVGTARDEGARAPDKYLEGQILAPDELPVNPHVAVEMAPNVYPDYFELQGVPIVSERLVVALRGAGITNFDAYPAPVVEAKRTVRGHYFLNVIGRVGCLDDAATKGTRYRGRLVRVDALAVDEARARGQHLFRLREKQTLILVSERVQRALRGLSGAVVKQAQGWTDRDRF